MVDFSKFFFLICYGFVFVVFGLCFFYGVFEDWGDLGEDFDVVGIMVISGSGFLNLFDIWCCVWWFVFIYEDGFCVCCWEGFVCGRLVCLEENRGLLRWRVCCVYCCCFVVFFGVCDFVNFRRIIGYFGFFVKYLSVIFLRFFLKFIDNVSLLDVFYIVG